MAAEATARILIDGLPAPRRPLRLVVSADAQLEQLDRLLVDERVNFTRVGPDDWEARTFDGDVGRGDTLGGAIAELCTVLRG